MTVLAANVVPNGSFENWGAGWSLDWNVANVKEEAANVHSGTMAVNFWSGTDATFSVSRQVTGVAPGAYTLSVWNHGAPEVTGVSLSAVTSAGSWSVPMPQTGWALWANPTVDDVVVGADGVVTVAVGGSVPANGWGWFDDVVLTPSTGTVAPDTSALDAALAAAGAVHRAWYTDASLAALDHAVEVGHVVLAGSFATADDVAAATALVNDAIAGLEVSALAAPTVTATLAATTVNTVTAASVHVTVGAGASAAPTGQVTVHYGAQSVVATLTAADAGQVTVPLPVLAAGTYAVSVDYAGDAAVAPGSASAGTLTVVKLASKVTAHVRKAIVTTSTTAVVDVTVGSVPAGTVPTGTVKVTYGTATKEVAADAGGRRSARGRAAPTGDRPLPGQGGLLRRRGRRGVLGHGGSRRGRPDTSGREGAARERERHPVAGREGRRHGAGGGLRVADGHGLGHVRVEVDVRAPAGERRRERDGHAREAAQGHVHRAGRLRERRRQGRQWCRGTAAADRALTSRDDLWGGPAIRATPARSVGASGRAVPLVPA